MSLVSAHVLDVAAGIPAAGLRITLEGVTGERLGAAITDADGRVRDLGPRALPPGTYQVTFSTGDYLSSRGQEVFFPMVAVSFRVAEGESHYHVPLLLSPYSYTTYRGS